LTNNILNRNAVIFVGLKQTVDIVPTPVVRTARRRRAADHTDAEPRAPDSQCMFLSIKLVVH